LILFSFLGTLARLGLQWLTNYAGAPVFPSVWFNFGGSAVMGFLAEDRMLFRHEWGTPTYEHQIRKAKRDEESGGGPGDCGRPAVDLAAAKKAHLATKKTIPLYIGLATGFCGSFTSFSSFMRDTFLAVSNDLTYGSSTAATPRNGGYSFMALLAVIIITVTASLSGLLAGAQLASALEPVTPSLPFLVTRRVADRLAVFLAWGCWAGAVVLAAVPPADYWRGVAVFSLVLAPLGTLARFYLALWLNGLRPAFPLGTFAANVLGTAVLGMAWDLQHVPLGGVVGCQVLQGVEDGFCGCLTTVSTWVAELVGLRRRHAWVYGGASVVVGFAVMVAVMGGLRWSDGFAALKCIH
jgi:fluoride ion exporter CrcB/FEX